MSNMHILDHSNMDKRICYIKVVVNPQATKSFTLRFELYPKKIVNFKIIIPNVSELMPMIDEIKNQIPMKYNFNIQFNWKNAPSSVKENKKFQEEMIKIFGNGVQSDLTNSSEGPNIEYNKLATIVKMHINNYGSAPNFRDNFTEKGNLKIHNYIKNILGMPKLKMEQTSLIAELVLNANC